MLDPRFPYRDLHVQISKSDISLPRDSRELKFSMESDRTEIPVNGGLVALRKIAMEVPHEAASAVRELSQKECDADARAHDGLVARGNSLLAASGVALGLLVGLARDLKTPTKPQSVLLVLAFVAAVVAGLLIMIGSRLATTNTVMKPSTVLGKQVPELGTDFAEWQRQYHLSIALSYCEIRMEIGQRHQSRGRWLVAAQWSYLIFICFVSVLGLTILC